MHIYQGNVKVIVLQPFSTLLPTDIWFAKIMARNPPKTRVAYKVKLSVSPFLLQIKLHTNKREWWLWNERIHEGGAGMTRSVETAFVHIIIYHVYDSVLWCIYEEIIHEGLSSLKTTFLYHTMIHLCVNKVLLLCIYKERIHQGGEGMTSSLKTAFAYIMIHRAYPTCALHFVHCHKSLCTKTSEKMG